MGRAVKLISIDENAPAASSDLIDRDVRRGRRLTLVGVGLVIIAAVPLLPVLFLTAGRGGIIAAFRVPGVPIACGCFLVGLVLPILGSILINWKRVDLPTILSCSSPAALPILLSCLNRSPVGRAGSNDQLKRMRNHALELLETLGEGNTIVFSEAQEAALVDLLRHSTNEQQMRILRCLSNSTRLSTHKLLRSTVSSISRYGPRPADSPFLARFVAEARHCETLILMRHREVLPASEYLRSSGVKDDELLHPADKAGRRIDGAVTLLRPRDGGEVP